MHSEGGERKKAGVSREVADLWSRGIALESAETPGAAMSGDLPFARGQPGVAAAEFDCQVEWGKVFLCLEEACPWGPRASCLKLNAKPVNVRAAHDRSNPACSLTRAADSLFGRS